MSSDQPHSMDPALNWKLDLNMSGPCDRCGHPDTLDFADSTCTACEHVPLCVTCLHVHRLEAIADGTSRWGGSVSEPHDPDCKDCQIFRDMVDHGEPWPAVTPQPETKEPK